jgi:hypothetical protein
MTMMEVRHVAVWKLHGASRIASGTFNIPVAEVEDPNIAATVTSDPEPHFTHIDSLW